MKEIGIVVTSLIEDRGVMKYEVNVVKDNKIFGFIKPV